MDLVSEKTEPLLGDAQLLNRLANCKNLPSPPGVASRIISLGQDVNASMADVAEAVSVDPALVSKVLRIANSAQYSRQRGRTRASPPSTTSTPVNRLLGSLPASIASINPSAVTITRDPGLAALCDEGHKLAQ